MKVPKTQQRWLDVCLGLLCVTGLLWLALVYGRGPDDLPHALEPWLLRIHGFANILALLVFGVIAGGHLHMTWKGLNRAHTVKQRNSGLLLGLPAIVSVLSAYGLYYFATDALHVPLRWVHVGAGLIAIAAWMIHKQGRRNAHKGSTARRDRPHSQHPPHGPRR